MIFIRADVSIGGIHIRYRFINIAYWLGAMVGNPKYIRSLLRKGTSLEFIRNLGFFSKSLIFEFLAGIMAMISFVSTDSAAKEVSLDEILRLSPMPIHQLLERFSDEEVVKVNEVESRTSRSREVKPVKFGKDYQISKLLELEPVTFGSWVRALGNPRPRLDDPSLVEVALDQKAQNSQLLAHGSQAIKVEQPDETNRVVIRVQKNQEPVETQMVDIEKPASPHEVLGLLGRNSDLDSANQKVDATSEFLSSYLTNIENENDVFKVESQRPNANKQIFVTVNKGSADVSPKSISGEIGDIFKVKIDIQEKQEYAKLFVRDRKILSWDRQKLELTALTSGTSEVFFSVGDQLIILPVDIHVNMQAKDLLSDLVVPEHNPGFTSLSALSPSKVALHGKLADNSSTNSADIVPFTPFEPENGGWKIKTRELVSPYQVDELSVVYDKVRLQLIDEQSVIEKKELKPAAGVELKILGTQYTELSDAKGMGSFINVPRGSRFFVQTSDASQYYAPSIVEVHSTGAKTSEPIRIQLMQNSLLHHLRSIHEIEANPFHASLCGVALGQDQKPLAGVRAFANYDADYGIEAIYFSELGFPAEAKQTGPDGRFCFLALEEGPIGIEFSVGTENIANIPVSVFSGKHLEQTFPIFEQLELKTHIASMPAAKDINLVAPNASDNRKRVDMANLITVSDETTFQQIDYGYLAAVDPVAVHNGRSCYVNESPEFEYAYYCYEQAESEGEHVTSLIPNGFIDNIFQKYNLSYLEPNSGYVLVEHGSMQGQEHDTELIVVELIDSFGNAVQDQVHITGKPTTRAAFFNLKPGAYTVMVKTNQGYWLDMDTVRVYSDTTSYLRTGSPVRYQIKKLASMP